MITPMLMHPDDYRNAAAMYARLGRDSEVYESRLAAAEPTRRAIEQWRESRPAHYEHLNRRQPVPLSLVELVEERGGWRAIVNAADQAEVYQRLLSSEPFLWLDPDGRVRG